MPIVTRTREPLRLSGVTVHLFFRSKIDLYTCAVCSDREYEHLDGDEPRAKSASYVRSLQDFLANARHEPKHELRSIVGV